MFLQNLRAKVGARLSGEKGEAGFTLIELLVVMLILGILAAIAIPAFFNQRDKATDAQAKSAVRTAETTMETWATEHEGQYTGAEASELQEIEPTLESATLAVGGSLVAGEASGAPGADNYAVSVESSTGTWFTIARSGGAVEFGCTPEKEGGCPDGGEWNK